MLKIMDPSARFEDGALITGDGHYLFHVVHSKTVSVLLDQPGPTIPLPHLFRKFRSSGGGDSSTELPLRGNVNPKLSMLRLILSPAPYATNCRLVVGHLQDNSVPVMHRTPVVTFEDYFSEPVKVPTTLMIAEDRDLTHAKPLSEDPAETFKFLALCKKVVINENKNTILEFDDFVNQTATPFSPTPFQSRPRKSILKTQQDADTPAELASALLHCQIFKAIGSKQPQLGNCPATAFNTITIMSRSQNSLDLFPRTGLKKHQQLFLKHVVLHRMGLESVLSEFITLYQGELTAVSEEEVSDFNDLVGEVKRKVEDIVFFLNSICVHKFAHTFSPGRIRASTKMSLEKFFLMFRPRDYDASLLFGSTIVDLICADESFNKLIKFCSTFMPINDAAKDTNLLKIYSLLTS